MLNSALFGWRATALSPKPAVPHVRQHGNEGASDRAAPRRHRGKRQRLSLEERHPDNFGINKLKKGLMEIKGYGGRSGGGRRHYASVEDVWMLARQLKPDAIFVDGGYMLTHPHEQDPYRRVAKNVP